MSSSNVGELGRLPINHLTNLITHFMAATLMVWNVEKLSALLTVEMAEFLLEMDGVAVEKSNIN